MVPATRFRILALAIALPLALLFPAACGGGGGSSSRPLIIVDTLLDGGAPPGAVTLRAAIESAADGQGIVFAAHLDGGTVLLDTVADTNAVLVGETFPMGKFAGYAERDYGPTALYARKNLVLDASGLPNGLTIEWTGGDANPARVLAVYGDLTIRSITITGGFAKSQPIVGGTQPYTLGRGGGIAVWGTAQIEDCRIVGNRAEGDTDPSRDRGSFGGGIYGNRLILEDCVVSGNSARGYGGAGGGVYSVGGADMPGLGSSLTRTVLSGNRVSAQHAYGGGVYSDGGGPGGSNTLSLSDCTIARNLVMDHDGIDEPAGSQYFYRGGGAYMSNGSLRIEGCTIVLNEVTGHPAIFRDRPNMAGGAIAATIGDAHVVEVMLLEHSIIAGNTVDGVDDDVYSGSLFYFESNGYNRVGVLDIGETLVPVPPWWSLSRKFWPGADDMSGVDVADVILVGGAVRDQDVTSVGADAGENAVLWYPPAGSALDRIPSDPYLVTRTFTEHLDPTATAGDFLNDVLDQIRTDYEAELGPGFGAGLGDVSGIVFYPEPEVWPSEPANEPWIRFWQDVDAEIAGRLGPAGLTEEFWNSLADGHTFLRQQQETEMVSVSATDQRGVARPTGGTCDIGAVEE